MRYAFYAFYAVALFSACLLLAWGCTADTGSNGLAQADRKLDSIAEDVAQAELAKEFCTRYEGDTRPHYALCMRRHGWKPLGWPAHRRPNVPVKPWHAQ